MGGMMHGGMMGMNMDPEEHLGMMIRMSAAMGTSGMGRTNMRGMGSTKPE
jgi:hypothetical protein